MYKRVSLGAATTLILSVAVVLAVAPDDRTGMARSAIQAEIPIFDLQINYPDLENLPVHEIPLP